MEHPPHGPNRVAAPTDDCPKCGQARAFTTGGPRYRAPLVSGYYLNEGATFKGDPDALIWTCLRCGYEMTTPTADARVPA